jgi:enoyl-CoA hydratase/carnithine racemase
MGGTQRLARLAGRAVAMDVALTGRRLTAREALAWGVVSRVVPRQRAGSRGGGEEDEEEEEDDEEEAVVREAQALAARAAALPARSVAAAKRAVAFAADADGGLDAGLDLEERLFHECFATREREEGMRAFLERRAPRWRASP